jgi:hypothetical protein
MIALAIYFVIAAVAYIFVQPICKDMIAQEPDQELAHGALLAICMGWPVLALLLIKKLLSK